MTYAFFSPAAGQNTITGPGTLTVQFANGTAGGHVSAGPLHVVSGTGMFNNTFSIPIGSGIMFTGMQYDVFPGSGLGTVTMSGMFALNTLGHIASGMIHCAGALCGLAGFTASVSMNQTSGPQLINFAGVLNGFPSLGPQNFMATGAGNGTPQGGMFLVNSTGQEVGRVVVPEPSTGTLLGLGLAGFGIALTTWRARRGRN